MPEPVLTEDKVVAAANDEATTDPVTTTVEFRVKGQMDYYYFAPDSSHMRPRERW